MRLSSIKAVKHLLRGAPFFGGKNFSWSEFVLPSTLQLSPYLELLLDPIDSKETSNRIQLGLHEALVNAVRHGNSGDSGKFLRVRRILTPNWLIWQVQDQGNGIPFESRVRSLPEKLDANSGRGLFLIHQCFDDVRWSPKGNRLQLAYRRNPMRNYEDNQDQQFLS